MLKFWGGLQVSVLFSNRSAVERATSRKGYFHRQNVHSWNYQSGEVQQSGVQQQQEYCSTSNLIVARSSHASFYNKQHQTVSYEFNFGAVRTSKNVVEKLEARTAVKDVYRLLILFEFYCDTLLNFDSFLQL